MKSVRIHLLSPAQTTYTDETALNLLLLAFSHNQQVCEFRFYGATGSGWLELHRQEAALQKGYNHLYFQLPGRCFSAQLWGEVPEELTLLATTGLPEPTDARVLLFRLSS